MKKNLRKPQAQFRKKLRKLRLRQNYGFLIKTLCAVKNSQKNNIMHGLHHTFSVKADIVNLLRYPTSSLRSQCFQYVVFIVKLIAFPHPRQQRATGDVNSRLVFPRLIRRCNKSYDHCVTLIIIGHYVFSTHQNPGFGR